MSALLQLASSLSLVKAATPAWLRMLRAGELGEGSISRLAAAADKRLPQPFFYYPTLRASTPLMDQLRRPLVNPGRDVVTAATDARQKFNAALNYGANDTTIRDNFLKSFADDRSLRYQEPQNPVTSLLRRGYNGVAGMLGLPAFHTQQSAMRRPLLFSNLRSGGSFAATPADTFLSLSKPEMSSIPKDVANRMAAGVTSPRTAITANNPAVMRHEMGHWLTYRMPDDKQNAMLSAITGIMGRNDPTFWSRLSGVDARRFPDPRAARNFVDDYSTHGREIMAQYLGGRSTGIGGRRLIDASRDGYQYTSHGVSAMPNSRLKSVMAHLERNYKVPNGMPYMDGFPSSWSSKFQGSQSVADKEPGL